MSIRFYYDSIFTYVAYLIINCKIILAISETGDGQEKERGRIRSSRASAIMSKVQPVAVLASGFDNVRGS